MYFDEQPEIRLADILIRNAVLSYGFWLRNFFLSQDRPVVESKFVPQDRLLVPSRISFRMPQLPDIWPTVQERQPAPEWSNQGYSYASLLKPILREAIVALRRLVRDHDQELEEKLLKAGPMTYYVLEGLRLHLLCAAAHSAYRNAEGVSEESVLEASRWKCWAWPWC